MPARLMADRGSESHGARAVLVKRESEPIIPQRRNNPVATQQDGRKLRRYKRRWMIERTRGGTTSGAWWPATSAMFSTLKPWCIWLALSSLSKRFRDDL
jgi:hypothetical protein